MLAIFIFIAVLIIMVLMVVNLIWAKENPLIKLYSGAEDEDIKIAGGSFGDTLTNEDYADKAAEEFLLQKDKGNIEEAGRLGEILAKELWLVAQDLLMAESDELSDKEVHQTILLYAYTINKLIADLAPNQLLAETSLSIFYSELEEISKIGFKHINDTAGFSLYILNQRSEIQEQEVGRVYAKLLGEENSNVKIKEGNDLYKEFYIRCKEICDKEISYSL